MTSAPSSFRIPVFGHEWAQRLLRAAVIEGRTAHAYLIEGPAQVGKTTLARALAQALTCESPQADEGLGACGRCRSCRLAADEGHPDHRFIEAGGGQIKIEQVRELIREAMLSPVEGQYKVFIISSFERANPSAANALLKTLEEPTPTTRIVLTTTEISALLPTIISRCQILHLRPLSRETVAEALVNGWGAPEEQARMLAGFSEGRLGWAVDMATRPELWQAHQERVAMATRLPEQNVVERLKLAARLAKDDEAIHTLQAWLFWWRDVWLVQNSCRSLVVNQAGLSEVEHFAHSTHPNDVRRFISALIETAQHLRKNVNRQLALEALLLKAPQRKGG